MRETPREGHRARRRVIRDLVRSCLLLVVMTCACTEPEAPVRALSVGSTTQRGAATQQQEMASQPEWVALVVGNGDYEDPRVLGDLSNPANDARDIAEVLERLGFRVTTKVNASYAEFREALRQFAKDSEKAAIGLLFYAGHGVEVEGVNYLLPVDAELSSYTDLRRDGLQLRRDVLGKMSGDGLRLVILDACRNQPELRRRMMRGTGTRALSASNGSFGALPDIDKSEEEILVAYAAAAGEEAYDGEGQRNSPYTAALLQQLEQRKPLEQVFKAVRRQVVEETRDWAKGPQKPFEYGSLVYDYYLAGRPAEPTTESHKATEHWERIEGSDDPADFEIFVLLYPDGPLAELARGRLQKYREREEELWKSATARNTLEAFLSYLRDYPKGRFAVTARLHVQELAAANADSSTESPTEWGRTGLHWAAERNAVEVARVLLEAGAAVDARDRYGYRPLDWAAKESAAEVARVLLDAGTVVDGRYGFTPLHYAAMRNAVEVARMLLDAGAGGDAGNVFGNTPLHVAAYFNAVGVARMLLEAGADIDAVNGDGETPLDLATQKMLLGRQMPVNRANGVMMVQMLQAALLSPPPPTPTHMR